MVTLKILFLDIDGVLNSTRTCVAFGGYPIELEHINAFDQVAIRLIQRLCDAADVKVVLSSAWRLHYPYAQVARALGLPIIDKTPYLIGPRGMEINAWLSEHPLVEQYAILDDDADMLPDQLPHFVRTDGNDGLTWAGYQKLCSLFQHNPYDGSPRHRNWRNGAVLDWSGA